MMKSVPYFDNLRKWTNLVVNSMVWILNSKVIYMDYYPSRV